LVTSSHKGLDPLDGAQALGLSGLFNHATTSASGPAALPKV
jgi:hypothetical protein